MSLPPFGQPPLVAGELLLSYGLRPPEQKPDAATEPRFSTAVTRTPRCFRYATSVMGKNELEND
jgi:hypothetical protein